MALLHGSTIIIIIIIIIIISHQCRHVGPHHENENIVSENYESGIINLYYTQDITSSDEYCHFLLARLAYKPWPLSTRYLSDTIITYKKGNT